MRIFRLKNLVLISISLLSFCCSVALFPGYEKSTEKKEHQPVLLLTDDSKSMLFNTQIDLFKNHYSGLTVIKKFSDTSHRVVFVTEMGLKIFDIELFEKGVYKVHFIPEWMNKKPLIKTLANDFGLLTKDNFSSAGLLQKNGKDILKMKENRNKKFYFIEDNKVGEILQVKGVSKKVNVDFYRTENEVDSVKINHYNIKLSIQLSRINTK